MHREEAEMAGEIVVGYDGTEVAKVALDIA
jgi:hypothetical protein